MINRRVPLNVYLKPAVGLNLYSPQNNSDGLGFPSYTDWEYTWLETISIWWLLGSETLTLLSRDRYVFIYVKARSWATKCIIRRTRWVKQSTVQVTILSSDLLCQNYNQLSVLMIFLFYIIYIKRIKCDHLWHLKPCFKVAPCYNIYYTLFLFIGKLYFILYPTTFIYQLKFSSY